MPFETFTDSRGQKHEIYMQESDVSCGIASVCTLLNLMTGSNQISEEHLRELSKKFAGGYKVPSVNVAVDQFTILDALMRSGSNIKSASHYGSTPSAVAKLLAEYNLYSSRQALNEVECAGYDKNKFEGKILLFGITDPEQLGHFIIVRDVWDDGTIIIYDSAKGLVESKEFGVELRDALVCAYVNYQSNRITLDLESGQRLPGEDDVIIGAEEPKKRNRLW